MTDRIEAIRARHAARLRTRADATTPPSLVSTLVDDDMAVLLAAIGRVQALAQSWWDQAIKACGPTVHSGCPDCLGGDYASEALEGAPVAPDAEPRGAS